MDMGSFVGLNQVLPFAGHLTKEHNIPIPGFQDDDRSDAHTAANVTDWHDEHLGEFTHLDWHRKIPRFESSKSVGTTWNNQQNAREGIHQIWTSCTVL